MGSNVTRVWYVESDRLWQCTDCLLHGGQVAYRTPEPQQMLAHLEQHEQAGHTVALPVKIRLNLQIGGLAADHAVALVED